MPCSRTLALPACRPILPPHNPNKTMNKRKSEMVQVTDELAVSRRLYGVLERLADWLGEDVENMLYDGFDGLRRMAHDEFTDGLRAKVESARVLELVKSGAFRDGGYNAVEMDIELDRYTYAKLQKLADGAGCGVDEFVNCLLATASAEH